MIREAIAALVNERRDLSRQEAAVTMTEIMNGEATSAQLAAFLIALRIKGETVEELTGMAEVMRRFAVPVPVEGALVDTCGTGGAGSGAFNISTAAAFVVAGAGGRVAKHGNRAMSSPCGSADVLEALGARIDLAPDQVARCIREVGFGFMFAPSYHPAMKHAGPTRRELGVRTAFNVLGPLTNPAGARSQLLGVAQAELAAKMAAVLQGLGSRHALVVHGSDGLDELTLSGPSQVHELRAGAITVYEVSPRELGLREAGLEDVKGGTAQENAAALRAVLAGADGALRDIVLLNAAAALVAADLADTISGGLAIAQDSLDSGEALRRLNGFVELTAAFS